MAIVIRCNSCKAFISIKNTECTRCKNDLKKGKKLYYIQHKVNGKQKFTYAGNLLNKAKDVEARIKVDNKLGKIPEYTTSNSITFEDFIDKHVVPEFVSKNKSYDKEYYRIKNIKQEFGSFYIKDVTNAMITSYYNRLLQKYATATANNYLARIKRIFNLAVELEFISATPIKVKKKTVDNTVMSFLSDKEKQKLLDACKYDEHYKNNRSSDLYNVVCLALYAGLRRGEITKLKKRDIIDGKIFIRPSNAKSGKGRYVPMSKEVVEVVESIDGEFEFPYGINRSFKNALKRAGIDSAFRFHDLRHSFASELVRNGVSLYTVQQLLGHSSYAMTQRYAHLAPDFLQGAIDKLK